MLLVAHRMPRTVPECVAFLDAGARMFECDVQFRHEQIVVSHYLPFLRIPGWLEHDDTRFRWRKGIRRRDNTLAEALALLPGDCGILLDPKETDRARRASLIRGLARELPERGRFRVSTDDGDDLARFRAAGFATWRTIKRAADLDTVIHGRPLADVGVSVRHTLLDARTTAALRGVTDNIVVWTVNDAERAAQLREFGADGVTSDRVEVLRTLSRTDRRS